MNQTMAAFYKVDYYLVDGPQRVIVLYNEEPPRITFILLDPIILVFVVDISIPLAEEAIVTEVGKAAVPEDAEDADPKLVANNKL